MISGAPSLACLIMGTVGLLSGKVTDKFGPRVLIMVSSILLGAGYILVSRISSLWQLYLVYGLMIGGGMSAFWIPVLSMVSRWFHKKRGTMIGIALIGPGTGLLVGPLLVNWLILNFQWRFAALVIGIGTLLIGVLISQFLRRDPSQVGQFPDGEAQAQVENVRLDSQGLSLKTARSTHQLWMAITIIFCLGFCGNLINIHTVPYALSLNLSSTAAASVLALVGLISIPGVLLIGLVGDKLGAKKITILSVAMHLASVLWLIYSREVWQLYLVAVIYGLVYKGVGVNISLLAIWLFGLKSSGLMMSALQYGLALGAAISPWLTGYIVDTSGSYQLAFYLAGGIGALGLLLAFKIKPISKTAAN